jgi:hypothetical protein
MILLVDSITSRMVLLEDSITRNGFAGGKYYLQVALLEDSITNRMVLLKESITYGWCCCRIVLLVGWFC